MDQRRRHPRNTMSTLLQSLRHTPLRMMLLFLVTLFLAHSGSNTNAEVHHRISPGASSAQSKLDPAVDARISPRYPSLHHTKYLSIHFYADPMRLSRKSGQRKLTSASEIRPHQELRLSSKDPQQEDATQAFSHPVHALEQTFHFQTFLLRVKVPITVASREALSSYLHPFKLGHYVPHHAFLVTLDAHHKIEASLKRWLTAAPGVVGVWRHEEHQKLHPRITHAVKKAHTRNLKRSELAEEQQVEHDAAAAPHEDWNWNDFAVASDTGRWQNQFAAHPSNLEHPPRDFSIVELMIDLRSHPHHRHSPAGLIRAEPGSPEHEQHMAWESEAMEHARTILDTWSKQLQQLELNGEHEDLSPLDHSDREWLRASGHNAQSLTVSHSMYGDEHHPHLSSSSLLLSRLSTPFHAHFTLLTPTSALLACSSWFLPLATRFLQGRNEVAWIAPHVRPVKQNKFIRGILQADRGNATPIWSGGIRGAGQIVQLGDTGLDTDSCFFSDPHRAVPVNQFDSSHRKLVTYQLFENADHGDDAEGHGTHVGGSLAGMVLGSELGGPSEKHPLAEFNGMAPEAKIAFYDFKRNGAEELLVPPAVYKPYLGAAYTMGARVSSNSWGSPTGDYGSYCQELDQFTHDFPDSLIVFAAGNYGETGWNTVSSPGVSKNVLTVGSTKTSPAAFAEAGYDVGLRVLSGPVSLQKQAGWTVVEGNFGAKFSDVKLAGGQARLVVADPPDACTTLKNTPSELDGAVVLVRRGVCHFGIKVFTVQTASGGKVPLVLVVNTEDGPAARMAGEASLPAITLCAVMLTKSVGESLISATLSAAAGKPPQFVTITAPVLVEPPNENESILSSFSSRGPTFGGRLKPDVLGVGEFVRSVRSDGNLHSSDTCPTELSKGVMELEGTSMATPTIAAAAALTRQYLQTGYYPSGRPSLPDVIRSPTSALVKALLIHSAMSAAGEVVTKKATDTLAHEVDVRPAPSDFQGYGRVLLENVLRFAEENTTASNSAGNTTAGNNTDATPAVLPPFSSSPLVSIDRQLPNVEFSDRNRIESEQVHSFCYLVSLPPSPAVSTSSNSSTARATLPFFRATLVWTDPPASSGASFVLVNNLDLFVQVGFSLRAGNVSEAARRGMEEEQVEGRVFLGNAGGFVDGTGRHEAWDLENNVEQVSFSAPDRMQPGDVLPVIVHVRGTHVPDGAQHYSLVVTGWFADTSSSPFSPSFSKRSPLSSCFSSNSGASADGMGVLCPGNCGREKGRGNCSENTGECKCEPTYAGDDCSQESVPLAAQGGFFYTSDVRPVPSNGWVFYTLTLPHGSDDRSLLSDLATVRLTMTRTSSIGDPDIYVSFTSGAWPTLREHDLADTQCDTCIAVQGDDHSVAANGKPSLIDVTASVWLRAIETSEASATIRIGVHGYCCDASAIQLTVEPIRSPTSPSVWLWLAPLLVVLVCAVACAGYLYRRKRRTAQGLDVIPVPMANRSDHEADVDDTTEHAAHHRPPSPSRSSRGAPSAPPVVRGQFHPLETEEEQHLKEEAEEM